MNRNPAGVYFVEDRIESNGFRVAGYLGLANTARLRLLIQKVKPVLEQWASIREGFENFPSYAGADLFDWLSGVEKPSGLDVKQQLPLSNCEGLELFATTTLLPMVNVQTFLQERRCTMEEPIMMEKPELYKEMEWPRISIFTQK